VAGAKPAKGRGRPGSGKHLEAAAEMDKPVGGGARPVSRGRGRPKKAVVVAPISEESVVARDGGKSRFKGRARSAGDVMEGQTQGGQRRSRSEGAGPGKKARGGHATSPGAPNEPLRSSRRVAKEELELVAAAGTCRPPVAAMI